MPKRVPWWSMIPTIAFSGLAGIALSNGVAEPSAQEIIVKLPGGQADGLERRLCEPIPSEPIGARIAKAQSCAERPIVQSLRSLVRQRKVPFHYVGAKVRIGVQNEERYRPGEGRVNVCRSGPFVGQRLQPIEPASMRAIEVETAGVYTCALPVFPQIQLDPADAQRLFRRPVDKYERAIVVAL